MPSYAPLNKRGRRSRNRVELARVLLPVKLLVVFHGNLGRYGQAARLADEHVLSDFPMGTVLAFTHQEFDLTFRFHLKSPEFIFYFANEVGESVRDQQPARLHFER